MKIYRARTFEELYSEIEHFRDGISSTGRRYIYLQGNNTKLPIHTLLKPAQYIHHTKGRVLLDEIEEYYAQKVVQKINSLYDYNDKRTKSKNLIVRIICAVRDWLEKSIKYCGADRRFYWHEGDNILSHNNTIRFFEGVSERNRLRNLREAEAN